MHAPRSLAFGLSSALLIAGCTNGSPSPANSDGNHGGAMNEYCNLEDVSNRPGNPWYLGASTVALTVWFPEGNPQVSILPGENLTPNSIPVDLPPPNSSGLQEAKVSMLYPHPEANGIQVSAILRFANQGGDGGRIIVCSTDVYPKPQNGQPTPTNSGGKPAPFPANIVRLKDRPVSSPTPAASPDPSRTPKR